MFAVHADALQVLGRGGSNDCEETCQLVRQQGDTAEPLEQTFNGVAKSSFNKFKTHTDEISTTLNNALVGITQSIAGQNVSFVTAADEGADLHRAAEGAADFAGADTSRFAPRA